MRKSAVTIERKLQEINLHEFALTFCSNNTFLFTYCSGRCIKLNTGPINISCSPAIIDYHAKKMSEGGKNLNRRTLLPVQDCRRSLLVQNGLAWTVRFIYAQDLCVYFVDRTLFLFSHISASNLAGSCSQSQ